jgi:hypothetical protein
MGVPLSPAPRRRATVLVALLCFAIAFLVVAPMGALATSANSPTVSVVPGQASGGLTATAAWNGVNVATANTSSAAFHITFNGAVNILYTWTQSSSAGGGAWSINDARLQMFYFGFALATRDISTTTGRTSGTLLMGNWSTGPLQYIIEGTYLLTASLLATNSTTAWSQSFWVDVAAPFSILAILPIVLLLIAVYEAYSLCCSGQHYRATSSKGGTPPSTPAASAPPATTPSATTPSAEPTAESPPPSGGTS